MLAGDGCGYGDGAGAASVEVAESVQERLYSIGHEVVLVEQNGIARRLACAEDPLMLHR